MKADEREWNCRVWQIPFFDQIQIPNIIWFLEITKYQISNTIRYWENLNTEYYLVLRKYKYRIRIVLFRLTIWIPNTKYRIVYKILKKIKLKNIYWSHTRHFVMTICETIRTGVWSNYLFITRILFGVPKNPNNKNQILFGIEKILIPNTNTTIRSNYLNSIRIPNYSSHLGWFSNQLCHPFPSTALWRRHPKTVRDSSSS